MLGGGAGNKNEKDTISPTKFQFKDITDELKTTWKATLFVLEFCLFVCLHSEARGIAVPQPGIEPMPPALEARSLNHGTTREVPESHSYK